MTESWIDKFEKCLRDEQAVNPHKATQADIARYEREHNVVIPADWKEYFLRLNGTPDGFCGCECMDFGFWHLSQLKGLTNEDTSADLSSLPHPDSWYSFADYAINCVQWAVCFAPEVQPRSPVLVNRGSAVEVFSDGIDEFVSYLCKVDINHLMDPNRDATPHG